MKDVGRRGFMFSRIGEPFVIQMLRREFAKNWDVGLDLLAQTRLAVRSATKPARHSR